MKRSARPVLVAMDLEGVLVPEIWISVADRLGIPALKRTTRDEPDYDRLMQYRLDILDEHAITMPMIQEVIADLEALPGALEYVRWVRELAQLIILSDTFYQFAGPLMAQLDWPTLFCHSLVIGADQQISSYRLRMPDQKRASVRAFQRLRFRVIAFGDSYNDTAMLDAAEQGILFRPSPTTVRDFPHFPVIHEFSAMRQAVADFLAAD